MPCPPFALRRSALPFALGLSALLGGCASGGDFPSLAPRPVEQLSMEEPVREAPMVAANPGLRGQAQALLAEAQRGDTQFEAAYGRALPAVRASRGRNSEGWVNAQQAISRVEAARAVTTDALANLDRLVSSRDGEPTNADDLAEIRATLAEVVGISEDQQRRTEALRSRIGS